MRGSMDGWHGDEPELEAEENRLRDEYEEEHVDDWKYDEDRFDTEPYEHP